MSETERNYEPSVGVVYGTIGNSPDRTGALALSNANENGALGVIGVGLMAGGAYATIAGAVARGIQLAGKQHSG